MIDKTISNMRLQIDEINNFVTDTIYKNLNIYQDLNSIQKIKSARADLILKVLKINREGKTDGD